ncbi:MAG TPA: glutathione S-transferase N-terminal domain-containing protein [Sphingobium sp.]|nr:glutathione S-transferase N-terminal domain-containing protein [Sphingobium sp.]
MSKLDRFPITRRWPAANPDIIQLYSMTTPNGVKVSIALEEMGLPYEPHAVNIMANESWTPEFLALNPNGKIPAIIDPDGPNGEPVGMFESNAILLYLAEKTGKLIPADRAGQLEARTWLFVQAGHIGPMFGQVGYFNKFAGREIEDKRPLDRYVAEAKRMLALLENRLEDRDWLMGKEFSIVDCACLGWVRNLIGFYEAGALVDYASLRHVPRWLDAGLARPAVQRGLNSPARPA